MNPAAQRFFDITKDQAIQLPISVFLEEEPFLEVMESKQDLVGLRLTLNNNQTTVIESIIRIEHQEVMLCILHDLTEEIRHEEHLQRLKINAIDMSNT